MKALSPVLLAVLLASCAFTGPPETTATPAPAQSETLYFQSLSFPGHLWTPFMPPAEEGASTKVSGMLKLPPRTGRVPAVIITHGCASITSGELEWASKLNEFGIATFLVHSFGARHIPEVCTGQHLVNIASMLADAYGALELLANDPRIDASRIAILGLSFGGRTALWSSQARFQERYHKGTSRFAAHLALYPASCYIRLADEERINGGPIRIFHGAADDWTPIGPCKEYIARLRSAGVDADLLEYAGALHAFDDPQTPMTTLPDALTPGNCVFAEQDGKIVDTATGREAGIESPCVSRGVSIGYHAEAHRKVVQDVRSFLSTLFQLKS
jgi:dienelactone hydrolase